MDAIEILKSEHRVIERFIGTLEKAANRLEMGDPIRPGFFIDAADFIRGFADGCHHRKEENVLFKSLARNGMSETSGPVAVMLSEHEQGRQFSRGMRTAAERLQNGDQKAAVEIIANARGYAALLKQHIYKEDNILFPLAETKIPPSEQEKVSEDFEKVEHEETGKGVHEKFLGLVNSLQHEMDQ